MRSNSIYDVAFISLRRHGWAKSSLDMYHPLLPHMKMIFTLALNGIMEWKMKQRHPSESRQCLDLMATPLNPKKGKHFEYGMCAILTSLKYRKWQCELNWWMAIINSFPKFCFRMMYVISREGGVLHSNSLAMYSVGSRSQSLDLLWNLGIFCHRDSVLYETYLWIIFC